MREVIKTCTDSDLCSIELKALDSSIYSILHLPGRHIIHTKDDYDKNFELKPEICKELANIGIFHIRNDMKQNEIAKIQKRTELINKGLRTDKVI